MAKLPTDEELGGLPAAASRPIATYTPPSMSGLIGLGETLHESGEAMLHEDDELDLAKANADFLSRDLATKSELSTDQDYQTVQSRYDKSAKKNQEDAAKLIRNPSLRERFVLKTQDDVVRGSSAVKTYAQGLEGSANVAYADQQGTQFINQAVQTKDPVARAKIIDANNQLWDGLQRKGYLNPEQVLAKKRAWTKSYAQADVLSRINTAAQSGDFAEVDRLKKELEGSRSAAAQKQPPVVPPSGPLDIQDKSSDAGFGTKFGELKDVKGMIIHHTAGGGDVNGVIQTFKDRGYPAQFVIDRDGQVYQTLPDGARGQQMKTGWGKGAGLSNQNTEGVEIIAKNDADVTPAQRAAAARLVASRASKWGYDPKTSVWGHGEVNPGHKEATEGMSVVSGIRKGEFDGVFAGGAQPKGVQVASLDPSKLPGGVVSDAQPAETPGVKVAQAEPRQPHIYDLLDADDRETLIKQADTAKDAMVADQERARKLAKEQAQDNSDKREGEILKNVWGGAPTITAKDAANDQTLTREARERVIGIINRDATGEPPAQVSNQNTMNLLADIRRPDNDPLKITDTSAIDAAYIKDGKLTRSDYQFLMKEVTDARTPEGSTLQKRKQEFINSYKAQITKSNPLMGSIDASGDANFYQFNMDVDKRMNEYRQQKKNPYDLFDPAKPDFIGNPKTISGYQKPLQTSIRDRAAAATGSGRGTALIPGTAPPQTETPQAAPVEAPADAPASPVVPRLPGETPAAYLKRIGKN